MTSRIFDFINQINEWQLFIGLFVYAFFIRFPFFFRDYIDRDESTFILMGQSWAEGNLPYTELWDLKPPVTFLFFALIIKIFGKSFVAIRIAGTFLVAISAFYTYKIGADLFKKTIGQVSAFLVVVLFSLFGSMQGVMSEHICMAFFMPGIYFFLKNSKWHHSILSGLFFGMALMSKLNMGYPLVLIFLWQLWHGHTTKTLSRTFGQLILCGTAICLIIFLTFLPYWASAQQHIWWNSVVKAPLAYSSSNDNTILNALPMVLVVILLLALLKWIKLLVFKNQKENLLLITILGILFSFMQAGKANGHYLIQLHPFFVVLVVQALSTFSIFSTKAFRILAISLLFLLPMETYAEWVNVFQNKRNRGTYFNGEGISVPRYFQKNNITTDNVLFYEYHIGYWSLGINPLTKPATHPSNMLREELFPFMENPRKTEGKELKYVLETLKPAYIITRKNRRIFHYERYSANFYAQLKLLEDYHPLDTVENAVIHKRLPIQ